MHEILSSFAVWLSGVLVVVLAIGGSWLRGKSKGRQEAECKAQAEQSEALQSVIKERANVDENVNRLPDGAAAERLRSEYSRD